MIVRSWIIVDFCSHFDCLSFLFQSPIGIHTSAETKWDDIFTGNCAYIMKVSECAPHGN